MLKTILCALNFVIANSDVKTKQKTYLLLERGFISYVVQQEKHLCASCDLSKKDASE